MEKDRGGVTNVMFRLNLLTRLYTNTYTFVYFRWTCWTPKYEVYDAQDQLLFRIEGDCCYCKCCTDVRFQVCTQCTKVIACIIIQ